MNRAQRRRAGARPNVTGRGALPIATVHVTGTHDGDRERLAIYSMFDEWYCGCCGAMQSGEPFGYSTVVDDPRPSPLCERCTRAYC